MKRQGYTFVEMMVVLAIIMLLMAIVVPRFAVSQRGEGLKGAANELSTALRAARRLAIMKREVRALALDIYSIPAQFMIMRPTKAASGIYTWTQDGESHAFTSENIAVVGMTDDLSWSDLSIARTDDVNLDGAEEAYIRPPNPLFDQTEFNPQVDPTTGEPIDYNGHVNPIYHLIKFQPTGTADRASIYLWNIEDGRQEVPAPTYPMTLSNINKLGVPPGFMINNPSNQEEFFRVPTRNSPLDINYYTIVVNKITGAVTVYDYAYAEGGAWDRKKDGR
jgi:prepilin-type N-terminal cleavage/methylation domain-containing protein